MNENTLPKNKIIKNFLLTKLYKKLLLIDLEIYNYAIIKSFSKLKFHNI